MGRTDSEAAFQEFLKRIPSATNLAAAANATLDTRGSDNPPSISGAGTPTPTTNALTETGIPRVASLDVLRQLVLSNATLPAPKQEPVSAATQAGEGTLPGWASDQSPPPGLPTWRTCPT